jgi:hypothetical protein
VRLLTNFTIFGRITGQNDSGIWLATDQLTSFLNFNTIASIKLQESSKEKFNSWEYWKDG